MSQENNNQPRNEGGQRRQGNNNRNRNRNNQGGNRNNQGRQQGRQSGGGSKSPQRRYQRKPLPLTTWEKILKFFGLYKEPTRPPRRKSGAQADDTSTKQDKAAPKSNTRTARGKSAQGDGRREKRDYPVDTPRLYLGNLSYDADEASLEELFKGSGSVRSVEIVYNRHTHRSKGFGFIEMQSVEEAKRAVEELHGKDFMGRNLVVNGASNKPKNDNPKNDNPKSDKPREDRPPRERKPRESKPTQERGERRSRPASASKSRLHVENLSYDVDESSLEELFKGVGNVRRVEIGYDREARRSTGSGFVEMQKSEDSRRAVEVLHDQPFMGRQLVVTEEGKKPQESKPAEEPTQTPVEAATVEAPAVETPVVETPVVETPTEPAEEPAKTTAE